VAWRRWEGCFLFLLAQELRAAQKKQAIGKVITNERK